MRKILTESFYHYYIFPHMHRHELQDLKGSSKAYYRGTERERSFCSGKSSPPILVICATPSC